MVWWIFFYSFVFFELGYWLVFDNVLGVVIGFFVLFVLGIFILMVFLMNFLSVVSYSWRLLFFLRCLVLLVLLMLLLVVMLIEVLLKLYMYGVSLGMKNVSFYVNEILIFFFRWFIFIFDGSFFFIFVG